MTLANFGVVNDGRMTLQVPIDETDLLILLDGKYGRLANGPQLTVMKITEKDINGNITARENILVTNRAGNQLTVDTRAYEPVAIDDDALTLMQQALPFSEGSTIEVVFSQKLYDNMMDEIKRLETAKLNLTTYNAEKIAYAASSTGDDDYEASIPEIASYIDGQTFKIKADVPNTGASTLKINALAILGLKKLKEGAFVDLETGDLIASQIFFATYNSASGGFFQFSVDPAQVIIPDVSKINFGGTGSDGALNISSGTTSLTMVNNYIEKNYSSITISGSALLDIVGVSGSNGGVAVIRCKGNFTMTGGTIDMSGQGGAGSNGGTAPGTASQGNDLLETLRSNGGGPGDGTGSGGSATGGVGGVGISKEHRIYVYGGYNGAGGAGGKSLAAGAGHGGRGGGCLIIEVGGTITFTGGNITANGDNGTNLTASSGGGGGGGAGGTVILGYVTLGSITGGTIACNGGNGGTGNLTGNQYGGGGGGGSYSTGGRGGGTTVGTTGANGTSNSWGTGGTGAINQGGGGGGAGYYKIFKNNGFA